MATQIQQHPVGSESGQSSQLPTGQYHNDTRGPYISYPQLAAVSDRDMSALSHIFGGLGHQNQRSGPGAHFVYLPNAQGFGTQPQLAPFPSPTSVPGQGQLNQGPFLQPCMIPNANSSFILPSALPPYAWTHVVNSNLQDVTAQTKNVFDSEGEHKTNTLPRNASGTQTEYPFTPAPIAGLTLSGYPYGSLPQLPQPGIPYQMMKSSNGYVLQDLEALTQQDPPIPRAVPAMWTNPSEINLAKCLENREGITNVYIRGFLPETTDEMLHGYASRFGKIDRCKAIIDLDTGLCKGFVLPYQDSG